MINAIKSLGVFGQLVTDILGPNEDGFQVRPCSLNVHIDRDDLVSCGQLLLPGRHLSQEMGNVFGGHHILKLHLKIGKNLLKYQ